MRRLPLVIAALTIQACIGVQEFSDSWAKGTVDPALEGTWKRVDEAGENLEWACPETVRFTRTGDRYLLYDGLEQPPGEEAQPTRTLRIGGSRLLMIRAPKKDEEALRLKVRIEGVLIRYEVSDGLMREFFLEVDRIEALLKSRSRAASSIGRVEGVLLVKRFDKATYDLFSEVAGDSSYWFPTCEYCKQP